MAPAQAPTSPSPPTPFVVASSSPNFPRANLSRSTLTPRRISSNSQPQPKLSPPPPDPQPANTITGTITGFWGFDPFKGPTLNLQDTPGKDWKLADGDVLIAGRENHLTLSSTGTACIDKISLDTATGKQVETQWKPAQKPAAVDISASLKSFDPGTLHLAIQQFGDARPDIVTTKTYSEPATLKALELHAGDTTADLTGTSLDQVQQLTINDLIFTPAPPSTPSNQDTASPTPAPSNTDTNLRLTLPPNSQAPKLRVGEHLTASFSLKDGRTLTLPVTVAPARPSVTLLSKSIGQSDQHPDPSRRPGRPPRHQQLTFSLKSAAPFPRTGQLEIANADETLRTTLSVASGSLVLQNPHTLLATLDPLKAFGNSAFGPLRLRPVSPDGTTGDWLPLVTLVRLPTFKDLHCPPDTTQPCTISGSSLYLVDSIATDADFTTPPPSPKASSARPSRFPAQPRPASTSASATTPPPANSVTLPILPQQALTDH